MVATLVVDPSTLAQLPAPAEPIVGGQPVAAGEWKAVVALDIGGSTCTGTYIGERVVLTAAHCIPKSYSPTAIFVKFGHNAKMAEQTILSENFAIHPDYCSDLSQCSEDIFDFAAVVLKTEPVGVEPIQVLATQAEWDESVGFDAPTTILGFGIDGDGNLGILQRAETTISRFSLTGREFRAGGDGVDACIGDSGGPALVQLSDGSYRLAGVASRGLECGKGGFYGVPEPAFCWLAAETGLDLARDTCGPCGCLDTDPTRNEGCQIGPTQLWWSWLPLALLGLQLGRRRK